MNDHPHVRACFVCVACGGSKDCELLLCWPCHHKQKSRNDGMYSNRVERDLDKLENEIRSAVCQD